MSSGKCKSHKCFIEKTVTTTTIMPSVLFSTNEWNFWNMKSERSTAKCCGCSYVWRLADHLCFTKGDTFTTYSQSFLEPPTLPVVFFVQQKLLAFARS